MLFICLMYGDRDIAIPVSLLVLGAATFALTVVQSAHSRLFLWLFAFLCFVIFPLGLLWPILHHAH
jgi:hypothetical protein